MEWTILIEKLLASAFLIAMFVLLQFWCLPESYFFREQLHRHLGKYICWAGLDNYWSLFAPQPVSKNFLLGFELEFADGTVRPWILPEYSLQEGYQLARSIRFVKWHNQLLSQKDPVPRRAICKFILRTFEKENVGQPLPVRVHILRFYEPAALGTPALLPWLSKKAFTYKVES